MRRCRDVELLCDGAAEHEFQPVRPGILARDEERLHAAILKQKEVGEIGSQDANRKAQLLCEGVGVRSGYRRIDSAPVAGRRPRNRGQWCEEAGNK